MVSSLTFRFIQILDIFEDKYLSFPKSYSSNLIPSKNIFGHRHNFVLDAS